MPQFRLRTILVLTVVVAFSLLTLVKPSYIWFVSWPYFASGLCMFVFIRMIRLRPDHAFWASFILGIITFLAMTLYVELIAALAGNGPPDETESISKWLWEVIHGDREATANATVEFASFATSVHVLTSMVWSAIVTLLAQFLFSKHTDS